MAEGIDTTDLNAEPIDALQAEASGERGWRGRISASLIAGTLLAIAVALAATIYLPGFDGLDQAFWGFLLLVLVWPILMIWILFADSGWHAWRRALIPLALFVAADVAGLML